MKERTIEISVRGMVEFILRAGDINSMYMGAKRMAEGISVHQKIQKLRKTEAKAAGLLYESEVVLSHTFTSGEFTYRVDGRADGVITGGCCACIEEIKSTHRSLGDIEEEPEHWHWAQAKCYAYIYCELHDMDKMELRLTYASCDTLETLTFSQTMEREPLHDFFHSLILRYDMFAKMDYDRIVLRNETARVLTFPYNNYRKNQRELMVAVYRTIQKKKKLYVQAPTGTGKTISTLFPAVKALSEGFADKIFYLTAKTITRQAAEDALSGMTSCGLALRSITLTSKDKICASYGSACNPIECEFARGHFNRVNDAILDIVRNQFSITRDTITTYALSHRVCPFELELDVTLFCDVIIGDYNYVYDPKVQLKRFFGDGAKGRYLFLTDEAHNLVDRSREMFSCALGRREFMEVRKAIGSSRGALYRSIGKINKYLAEIIKTNFVEKRIIITSGVPEDLCHLLKDFIEPADNWLMENQGSTAYEEVIRLYFAALDFLRVTELYDSRYKTMMELHNKSDITIKLLCLDPSFLLAQTQKKAVSCVYFSATLTPLTYFRRVLGGGSEDFTLRACSPFIRDNLCLLIDTSISTKYKDRSDSYEKIADVLYRFVSGRRGNYFVFFSSYDYLTNVLEAFNRNYASVETVTQSQDMTEDAREQFLARFDAENERTLVGFLVLGGIFSEGIDLTGERLIGAAVIGVGLPLITAERNIIADYYNETGSSGFEYAYVYPGMNKVMQAAGRVIRQETDRGVVLLIEPRFLTPTYRELFPAEWSHYIRVGTEKSLENILHSFWEE